MLASGATLAWAASLLTSGDVAALGALASQTTSVGLVPAFSGLGSPYFDRDAVGVLTGITAATDSAHIARAAFEAVAHQVTDVVEAIEEDGVTTISGLSADGGATASALLMQLQADLLGKPLWVSDVPEASALGAALLAAHTAGLVHKCLERHTLRADRLAGDFRRPTARRAPPVALPGRTIARTVRFQDWKE